MKDGSDRFFITGAHISHGEGWREGSGGRDVTWPPDHFFQQVPKNLPGVRENDRGTFLNTSEKKSRKKSLETPPEPRGSTFRLVKIVLGTLLGPPGKSPKIIEKVVQLGPVDHLRSVSSIYLCPTYICVQHISASNIYLCPT